MHDRKGSVPPPGLPDFSTPHKGMLSPSAIVAGARNDIRGFPNSCKNSAAKPMLFTQQHGELGGFARNLEIIGKAHTDN